MRSSLCGQFIASIYTHPPVLRIGVRGSNKGLAKRGGFDEGIRVKR
jgi:hypothetical protein